MQVVKKSEQMYALLAIAHSLCPTGKLIEDGVKSSLQEKYAEKMAKMSAGDEAAFDELFSYACPKFVTPQPPAYDDPMANNSQDAYRLQLKVFLQEVRSASALPLLRSFLKLYTAIPLAKLAALMELDVASLRQQLLAMKRKTTVKVIPPPSLSPPRPRRPVLRLRSPSRCLRAPSPLPPLLHL